MTQIGSTGPRWALAASAIAILVCLFGQLGAIGLVGPDEPRYAWIARAMAETGDWITPRLYGQPWFEKPVLYYWAAAIGFRVHLPAEWAARLPSAFAALAAALAIGWLARKHYGGGMVVRSPVLLAPLLFSTSVAAIGFARSAGPDMLFAASITLAMASAASVLRVSGALRTAGPPATNSRGRFLPLALLGASLGMALLAKGPAAIVLAGGSVLLWAVVMGQWRAAFRLLHPLAIAALCIVALPWYALCAARNPDFLRVFIWQHNFERYVTPVFRHRQPFWFFVPIILLALIPWTVLLWPVAQEGLQLWREKSAKNSPGFFFACWAIFPIVFFSFSQSKLPGYVLPAVPPLALLCSVAFIRASEKNRAVTTSLAGSIGATWLVLAFVAMHAARRIDWNAASTDSGSHNLSVVYFVLLGSAICAAAASVISGFLRKFALVVGITALFAVLSVEFANLRILPVLDRFYSARPHAAFMRNDRHPDRIFTYHLRRDWNYGLALYFHRELPEWSPGDRGAALVLTTPEGFQEIQRFGRFRGALDESYVGILYVPVEPAP